MNTLIGTIQNIHQSGAVTLVDVVSHQQMFAALLINPGEKPSWLEVGKKVTIIFKETEVSLAKNLSGMISLRNRLAGTITQIEKGDLLSKITLDFNGSSITSVITTRSAEALHLAPGDNIEALIKANEITLAQAI
jgi:molybdate transport system regulatory protein